jgi:predicted ATPase
MSQGRRLAGAVVGGLPRPPTSFVGRADELRRLGGMVAGGRLVTLHGPGGAGKTRLSLEAAARAADRFPDGVCFADLAGLHEPELVPRAVAAAAQVRERPGQEALAALIDGLCTRRVLLILDNCEHLLDACGRVAAPLLAACPTVAVLATSREPLGLPAESVFPVPPMGTPPEDADPATALEAYDAALLFLARAERAVPGLVVSPSDVPVVARICRRLDGLPLAIELAASRQKVLSVAEIDERLADRFRLLRRPTADDDVPARQRTLRATIDWSYALLEEPERRLLQRLSVFSGGFGLDAVEDVCAGNGIDEEELLDLLAGLVDKSLVVRGEHAGRARHRLLDSIGAFAAERCAEHEDVEWLRARHFGHYLAMATRADEELRGSRQAEWLARMDAEQDNFRAALRWGMSAADPTPTLDLIWLLQIYWVWRGNFSEGRRWFDEAMARATDAPPSVNRARALARWGEIAEVMGEYGAARSRYEQSLAVGRAIGDPTRIGTALLSLGEVALAQGDLGRARQLLDDSLVEYRKAGDRERARWPLDAMAELALAEGDLVEAAKLLELSLSEARELGNELGIGETNRNLARVALARGDLVTARSRCEEALGFARRLGERSLEGDGLTSLSHLELDLGEAQLALDAARSALRVDEEMGRRLGMLAALEAVAAAMVTAGRPRPGARLYGAAAALRERLGTPALPPESIRHQRQREEARAELGEQRFASEWGRGARCHGRRRPPLPSTTPRRRRRRRRRRRWCWRATCGRCDTRATRCACGTAGGCGSSPPSWPTRAASSTSWTWWRRPVAGWSSPTRAPPSTRPPATPTAGVWTSSGGSSTTPRPAATRSGRRRPGKSWSSSPASSPPPTGSGARPAAWTTPPSGPARRSPTGFGTRWPGSTRTSRRSAATCGRPSGPGRSAPTSRSGPSPGRCALAKIGATLHRFAAACEDLADDDVMTAAWR